MTLEECTKEELIAWFRSPSATDAEFYCLRFIQDRRFNTTSKSIEEAIDNADAELKKYMECIKKANNTDDFDKKIKYLNEGNKHYELYEKYNREYDRLSKKQDKMLGIR